jgi:hypothetical protein
MKNEEFEKWLAENYCDHESREKYHALEGYKMRQPEIDALKLEAAKWKDTAVNFAEIVERRDVENAKLSDEVDRLKADAERLDWLEAHPRLGEIHVDGEVKDCYLYAVSGGLGVPLRAIIDAMKETK